MANTYPVVQSHWLGSLTHFLNAREKNEITHLETKAFTLFRQFLILKIAISFFFDHRFHWPLIVKAIAVSLVVLAAGIPRIYHLSLWATLGFSFFELWRSWPFTINHNGLEFAIVLLMCLIADDDRSDSSKISCHDLIKLLMLSVWFFSGIHKLFDGYYWNAEFFALDVLSNETALGHRLNQLFSLFGSVWGPIGLNGISCCTQGVVEFMGWQVGMLLALSWLTIIVEIFLPFSLMIPKFRTFGIAGLFIFQGFIAYFSGEIDFAFTAFAILLLFVPQLARFTYAGLACLLLVMHPWM